MRPRRPLRGERRRTDGGEKKNAYGRKKNTAGRDPQVDKVEVSRAVRGTYRHEQIWGWCSVTGEDGSHPSDALATGRPIRIAFLFQILGCTQLIEKKDTWLHD